MGQRETVSRKSTASGSFTPRIAHEGLKTPGRPLEPAVRHHMGSLFAHDFSRVRVHTDDSAAGAASDLGAKAYSLGADIAFGANRYSPSTSAGRRLLAHELAHVVQQDRRGASSAVEARADAAAAKVLRFESVPAAELGGAPPGYYPQVEEGIFDEPPGKPRRRKIPSLPELPPALRPQKHKLLFPWGIVPPRTPSLRHQPYRLPFLDGSAGVVPPSQNGVSMTRWRESMSQPPSWAKPLVISPVTEKAAAAPDNEGETGEIERGIAADYPPKENEPDERKPVYEGRYIEAVMNSKEAEDQMDQTVNAGNDAPGNVIEQAGSVARDETKATFKFNFGAWLQQRRERRKQEELRRQQALWDNQ